MARTLVFGDRSRKRLQRSGWVLAVLWWLEGLAFNAFYVFGRLLGPDKSSALGRWCGQAIGPRLRKSVIIKRNLAVAFPDKSDAELDRLVLGIWGNLGAVLGEYPNLETICHNTADNRLEISVNGDITAFEDKPVPAVVVTAHLANWEVAAGACVRMGLPIAVVYTPLQNPRLDRLLRRARQGLRCELIRRDESARKIVRQLARGGTVGMLVDQRVDAGEPVTFFGNDMLTTVTPARLALRYDCEVIPAEVQRVGNARFRVILHAPLRPDSSIVGERERILHLTRQINTRIEGWIRDRPQEWLCSKRRWPKDVVRAAGQFLSP